METNEFITSFYKEKISLTTCKYDIIFEAIPVWLKNTNIMIYIETSSHKECIKVIHHINTSPCNITIPHLPNGFYFLQILYESTNRKNYYIGINATEGFPIRIYNGNVQFIVPPTLESNKVYFIKQKNDWITKACSKSSNNLYQSDLPEIIELATKITKYKTGNYNKILAIHDWVAENLYYDYDALASGKYRYERYDALNMLKTRRTICRGYSKLAVTLLRAIGIPAIDVQCFALGESSDGGWNCGDNLTADANHVITFALADNRWIMMDPTWDSVNEYRNGEYIEKTAGGARHNYFDATLAFFSFTHRFIK